MSFDEFMSFVLYAPPGTSVFHLRNEGWTVGDHLAAFQLDVLNDLYWARTEDGPKGINRPERTPRPTVPEPDKPPEEGEESFVTTVADYVRMVEEAQQRELEGG